MNTIKFSKIKNKTTEQHNLKVNDIYEENIFNNKIQLYHPCNLNIFVTNICQNNCFFCINNSPNFKEKEITDEQYFDYLENVLQNLQGKGIEITITGGEPTLNPKRFLNTMKLCDKYNFPCRTVSTTGLNLLQYYEGKPLCQYMIEYGFIHNINISRMHFDEDKNQSIFKGKNISNDELSKLAMFFKMNDAEMRVSCNIIKDYIDSQDKMLDFVDKFIDIGVDSIMFRELISDSPILLPSILRLDQFEHITNLEGLTYSVEVLKYKDLLIKHYKTKKIESNDVVMSMSFNNGILRNGFNGIIYKDFKKG